METVFYGERVNCGSRRSFVPLTVENGEIMSDNKSAAVAGKTVKIAEGKPFYNAVKRVFDVITASVFILVFFLNCTVIFQF